ncbi:hypothetical protein QA612_14840 [Evansella sp. AB-P1]|uniref:hypothetical protein n=1 Tax=Evansella sp. AB-P1 TaxID=3037653 RepID=UPI00241E0D88|nr:hypothetical protein [Evansella sp. AB-P1]MDG5788750.1 hypothetical protein [Evansella sp. AB-P1]
MEFTIITLFCISILLFLVSIFQKDRTKEVEKQVENLSIQLMQEMYQLKKQVSIIEEETFISSGNTRRNSHEQLTRDDVLSMYEDGYSIQDISDITNRSEEEIEDILGN